MYAVPQELDCGHCLAGRTKTVVMRCDNFGGEGKFKLFPLDTSDKESQEQVPYFRIIKRMRLYPHRKKTCA